MPYAVYCLIVVLVTLSGVVNLIMPILYMTHASVLVLIVSCLLNPLICHYCPPSSSPCTLGQQVNTLLSPYLVIILQLYCPM